MGEKKNPKKNVTRVQLCGVQGCCPTVDIYHNTGKVVITDDNGSKVAFTKEQWQEALAKAKVET